MGMPNGTHQAASNGIAVLGKYIGLHTSAAGTDGSFEASGGSYARQLTSGWTPDGTGVNAAGQVNIPCAAGTYVEGSIWSTASNLKLSAPTGLSATGSGTGGTFTAGSYSFVVTAVNFNGETTKSNEQTVTLTGTTSSVALTWTAVTGATSYKIYRGTTAGSENILVATVTTNSYTDTNSAGVTASPPASNTASTFVGSAAFSGGSITVSGTGASINVTATIAA